MQARNQNEIVFNLKYNNDTDNTDNNNTDNNNDDKSSLNET